MDRRPHTFCTEADEELLAAALSVWVHREAHMRAHVASEWPRELATAGASP